MGRRTSRLRNRCALLLLTRSRCLSDAKVTWGWDAPRRVLCAASQPPQSALFAMATADVLLVNLWCHDIGREHGAGKPLLRTVLPMQASGVM